MKRIFAIMLAGVLVLTGCGGPSGAGSSTLEGQNKGGEGMPAQTSRVLSEPVYPDFPKRPAAPEGDGLKEWNAYHDAYNKYLDTLDALRGAGSGLEEAERNLLNGFAAKSIPLALADREGENTVFSPLSLWSALAMEAQCANGNSRQQVLDALGVDSMDGLPELVEHIWNTLYTDDGQNSLILANSIWLNNAKEGEYVQETLDTLAQKHYAGTYTVPMGTAEADQAITDWAKEQTNGLIGGDSPIVETAGDVLALLASSLYYRAGWLEEFAPEGTEEGTFTDAAGQESRVDFMHANRSTAKFLRRERYQAAALSTHLGEMVFVLPDEGITPESLLEDPEFLSRLDLNGEDRRIGEVQWSVPKFDVDSQLNLLEMLKELGITDLQDPDKADLSALTNLSAYLSDAVQLARVKVDEEGVEAAAATMLVAELQSAPINPEICVMDLNRPFLFVIRSENIPLFIGVVNQM